MRFSRTTSATARWNGWSTGCSRRRVSANGMASLWLPLARYAEDQAHQVGDDTKFFYPNAHLYRAWVIDAFNRDLPYDRFLKLQLAADRMPRAAPGDLAALGFLGLGPKYYNRNRLEVMADEWEDRVDTVTRTMLGLTVACARCHDHKFDPITHARLLRARRRLREHAHGQQDAGRHGARRKARRPSKMDARRRCTSWRTATCRT